jgi:hypothetical protein
VQTSQDTAVTHPRRRHHRWLIGLLIVVAVVLFTPCFGIIWDGGFPSTEFRLKFVDEAGQPVPGVALRVLTKAGGECHLYPVNEFLSDQTPTSDAHGEMVFHHVPIYVEFGGTTYYNLVGMKFGYTAPQYECVFLLDGQEVHRVWYDDLQSLRDRNREQTVTRRREYPDWTVRKWEECGRDSSRVRDLFDANGDGEFDKEEGAAAWYFDVRLGDPLEHGGAEDIKFTLVERTITVRRR